MNNYPTIKDYLEWYKSDAHEHGYKANEELATALLEGMKSFLDTVYAVGKAGVGQNERI